jgi:hypothetical protein
MPITDGVLTITPEDIKITNHLWDAFDEYHTEVSAQWLIRFAQKRGEGWKPFTYTDIERFYNDAGFVNFGFNNLIVRGWIKQDMEDEPGRQRRATYSFTEEFIARAYRSTVKP